MRALLAFGLAVWLTGCHLEKLGADLERADDWRVDDE